MQIPINLVGHVYGKLTVQEHSGSAKKVNFWKCVCECGNNCIVGTHSLRSGNTKSCGGIHLEKAKERLMKMSVTHGLSKGTDGKKTRIFRIWTGIKSRCFNTKVQEYPRYGGRGITMCKEWVIDFKSFHDWAINNGYSDNLSIDRKENDGDYTPDNCRWATRIEQCNNRRSNVKYEYEGDIYTLAQLARKHNMPITRLFTRLKNGWSIINAVTISNIGRHRKNFNHTHKST